jgi:hypothetical protein
MMANPFDQFDKPKKVSQTNPFDQFDQPANDFGARIDFGGEVTAPQKKEYSIPEQIIGGGEAALSTITGATGGLVGNALGTAEGLAESIRQGTFGTQQGVDTAQEAAQRYAGYGTYTPRTDAGRDYIQTVAEVAGALPAASGITAELQAASMGARQVGQSARAGADVLAQEAKPVIANAAQKITDRITPQSKSENGALSVGAAEVPEEVVQFQKFQELPVPITPTMSDLASGDARFMWKQFENEIAKDEALGKANRDAAALKNSQVHQNFDSFIDMTGSELPETNYQYATGNKVVDALYKGLEEDKAKVTKAYKAAEEKGELQGLVPQDRLDAIASFLNENRAKRSNTKVLQGFVDEAFVKEVGEGSLQDGTFRLKPMTIKQAEELRQEVGNLVEQSNGKDLYYAGQIKKMIDDAQEGLGGTAFKVARKLAKQTFDKYENAQIIDMLLSEKKGYKDAKVAPELVVQKAVMSGSVDDLKKFRSTLMKSGPDGMAAWHDVQAAVLRTIRDEAIKGKSVVDNTGLIKAQAGAMNKAISNLDKNGKLNLLFGKKDADKLRLLGEVSGRIAEQMTGTFNASDNMAWISALKKIPVVGNVTGALYDVISVVKNRQLSKKAQEAVNVEKTLKKQGIDLTKYKAQPPK